MSRQPMRGFSPVAFQRARKACRYSRGELARLSGMSVSGITVWENGIATPTVDLLARAVATLRITIEQVVHVPPDERQLRDLRTLAGLTQAQLAKQLGLSATMVAQAERGESPLREEVALAMAGALGTTPDRVRAAYDRAYGRPPGAPA